MKKVGNYLSQSWNNIVTAAALNFVLYFLFTVIQYGWIAYTLVLVTFLLKGDHPPLVRLVLGGLQGLVVTAAIAFNYSSGRLPIEAAVVIGVATVMILVIRVAPAVLSVVHESVKPHGS